MNVLPRASFDRAFRKLSVGQQSEIRATAARLPDAFGKPHVHAGIELRRVGKFFEFRAGLKLRVLFVISQGDVVLVTVDNHDDITRFVRENS